MNPVQNDDKNLANSQTPVISVSNDGNSIPNVQSTPVSAPQGIKEGPPAVVSESEQQPVEDFVKPSPELIIPSISEEEKAAGVVANPIHPVVSADAKAAGVEKSIPTGPVYANFPKDLVVAEHAVKTEPITSANKWRAVEYLKEMARNFFNNNQPPSEA